MGKTILAVLAGPAVILFVRALWWLATADTTPFSRTYDSPGGFLITFLGLAATCCALAYRFFGMKAGTNG